MGGDGQTDNGLDPSKRFRPPARQERTLQRAKALRQDMTGPEWALWNVLRQRSTMGVKFRRQHPFGPYILDFFCQEKLLAVEVDGRTHRGDLAREHDAKRDEYLRSFGVEVVRVSNDRVTADPAGVAETVRRLVRSRVSVGRIKGVPEVPMRPIAHPLPPPSGRGFLRPLYSALVPNLKGMEAADMLRRAIGVPEKVSVFTAASETFAQRNTNASIAETIERFKPVIELAKQQSVPVRGYISCVIACPFEGAIEPARVASVSEQLANLGVDEIDLGDTIGAGTPSTVSAMVHAVESAIGAEWTTWEEDQEPFVTLHLHDTFGRASECVKAALDLGVRSFDGAVAGLGGCPYASTPGKRAPGNISTETLVRTVHAAGYETGVDLGRLAEAAAYAREMVARSRAGGTT